MAGPFSFVGEVLMGERFDLVFPPAYDGRVMQFFSGGDERYGE
jgi:hypothetical protein